MDFPGGSGVKNLPANTGDADSIPGSGRSLGEGNGNPLQYSCLGNAMDRKAWQVQSMRLQKSQTHKQQQQQHNKLMDITGARWSLKHFKSEIY